MCRQLPLGCITNLNNDIQSLCLKFWWKPQSMMWILKLFFIPLRILTQLWWGPAYWWNGLTFTPSTPREMCVVLFASDTLSWMTEGFFKSIDRRLRETELPYNFWSMQSLVWNKWIWCSAYVVIIIDLVFSNSPLRWCCSEKPESSIYSNGVEMITRR